MGIIKVPDAYLPLLEDIRLLNSDQNNPNRTTIRQQEQIWSSLLKYGWTYPIITNKDGVYADGEQRAEVCLKHNEFFVPVLRLPIDDVDRRMLRQILNKLKGKHNKDLDNEEYIRILQQGEKEDLKALLESIDERLPEDLDESQFSFTIPETYEIIVECKDEAHQKQIFEKLKVEGYKLRILTWDPVLGLHDLRLTFLVYHLHWLGKDWKYCMRSKSHSKRFDLSHPVNVQCYDTGSVLVSVKCTTCPFPFDLNGLCALQSLLGEVKNSLHAPCIPIPGEWNIVQWHLNRDSGKFYGGSPSGYLTFDDFFGDSAKFYYKKNLQKYRAEVTQNPKKSIQEVFEDIINRDNIPKR